VAESTLAELQWYIIRGKVTGHERANFEKLARGGSSLIDRLPVLEWGMPGLTFKELAERLGKFKAKMIGYFTH